MSAEDPGGPEGEAFWELWMRHREWIETTIRQGWAARLRPRSYPAELFTSEVLAVVQRKLCRGLALFRGTGELHAFIGRVIENAARDVRRAWLRRPDAPGRAEVLDSHVERPALWASDALLSSSTAYRGRAAAPQHVLLEQRDRREKIHCILALLAAGSWQHSRWAVVLRLRYLDEWPIVAVAGRIGLDERTVYRDLRDGRAAFRALLAERFAVRRLAQL
jgi:DNA-directed RNA polymerase specialized sigma24 family protein